MKNIILTLGLLFTTTGALAKTASEGGPCSNMAKYGAMKSFRAVNTASGGDMSIAAFLRGTSNQAFTYAVEINESVADGADDGWLTGKYQVQVQPETCKVLTVNEVR